MRQRHYADGAVSLNLDSDDIADQNLDLYDNKGINIEAPIINENLADNVGYYIEGVNRDQFFKISKIVMDMENMNTNKNKINNMNLNKNKIMKEENKMKIYDKNIGPDGKKQFDIGRATEDQIFSEFDLKLTQIINKTSNKVSLIFLFAQGLLAGVSLVNILLLLQYTNFTAFLNIYSFNVREIFNFTHALTFGSLTGNGIKFISAFKRCKLLIG